MSKSAGNGVDPRVMVDRYGADSLRVWMSFIGEYSESAGWSEDGLKACNKLLSRIWNLQDIVAGDGETPELRFIINQTIKKVNSDIDSYKFNTAISAIMILVNEIYRVNKLTKNEYKTVLTLIGSFAPHLASEVYEVMGFGKFEDATFPVLDEKALILDEIELPVQVNGKVRGIIKIAAEADERMAVEAAKQNSEISKYLTENMFTDFEG